MVGASGVLPSAESPTGFGEDAVVPKFNEHSALNAVLNEPPGTGVVDRFAARAAFNLLYASWTEAFPAAVSSLRSRMFAALVATVASLKSGEASAKRSSKAYARGLFL